MTRVALAVLLGAFLGASLAACGKKGEPGPPPGQTDTLNKYKYPPTE